MEEAEQRKVFNASLVFDRKAVITAAGIDHEGSRIFLGLEDGMLEEFSLTTEETGAVASLTARKPIAAKIPILSLLPATPANCLAALMGDASLRFIHSDTLESKIIHKGPILGATVALPAGKLPLIAIAIKIGMGRGIRLSVHEIVPAGGQVSNWRLLWEVDVPYNQGGFTLAWAGESLIVGLGLQYILAWNSSKQGTGKGAWRELLRQEESNQQQGAAMAAAAASPMAVSLPRQSCALILVGSVGLIVNPAGEPVGNPVLLESLPAVRAMAVGEGMAVLVSEDGVRIIDPGSGKLIQGVGYGAGMRPSPGQPLRAAGGATAASSNIVIAGRHKVWALTPVAPAEQVKDLLSRRDYEGAEKLARQGLERGQAWAEEAYAQTALLLMHECRFSEAIAALDLCTPNAFQPFELFPLFPQHTQPWEPHATPLHWSLSGPLEPLEEIISRAPVDHHQGQAKDLEENIGVARQSIIQYLFRARQLPGVISLDGIDTLLMQLLIDENAREEASAFASVPNQVRPELVESRLESLNWHHALATLWAATSHAEAALRIWKDLAEDLACDRAASGTAAAAAATRERQEAIIGAAQVLKRSNDCSTPLVLSYLPWLLDIAPAEAGDVLASREDLQPDEILPLLPLGQETRWRYLEHLIRINSTATAEDTASDDNLQHVHTEYALALIAAIMEAAPHLTQLHSRQDAIIRHQTAPMPAGLPDSASLSVAALVSGGIYPDLDAARDCIEALRYRLRCHLEGSKYVDHRAALVTLEGSSLLEESAISHWALGEHEQVLKILAITLRDVGAAVSYAAAFLPPSEHRTLLDMMLQSEGDESPRWEDACRVVALLGNSLDSLEVVKAAPIQMPMPAAVSMVAPLLRERLHRRRHGQMATALYRAQATAGALRLAEAEERKVVMDENKACPDCHLRLAGKVFVVVQQQQEESRKSDSGGRYSTSRNGGDRKSGGGIEDSNQHGSAAKVLCLSCWNKRTAREISNKGPDALS